jgi:hypothetical protein
MRVYEVIVKGLEFVSVDAAFGAGENAASLLALKHPSGIKAVVTSGFKTVVIAGALGQRRPVIIGFGAIRNHRPVAPRPRTDRDRTTFAQRVYPLVNILTMFFAWGVSHA